MERSAISIISISIVFLGCVMVGSADDPVGAKGVTAYWTNYYAKLINWDMIKANVYCNQWDADKPYEWRSRYNWTAFCGPVGPQPPGSCGLCLNVTNTATKAFATVRIVDKCTAESLDLDYPVFKQIDTDGRGIILGHLTVDYEFVDCHDTTIRLYSD